jgi:hypothetical protein
MPGGAQLIGDLLQGAFGSSDIDPNQAALASGYTHVKTVGDDGKPLPKPTYWNPTTGDETDDPLSKLPIKQPGFFQRAFAPNDAARANSINASYVANPQAALQSNRTALQIGGANTAIANANRNKPTDQQDPIGTYLLSDRNPDAQNLSDIAGQVPQTRTGTTIAALNTARAADLLQQRKLATEGSLNIPEAEATTESLRNAALQPEYANAATSATTAGELGNPQLEPTLAHNQLNNSLLRAQAETGRIPTEEYIKDIEAGKAASTAKLGPTLPPTASEYNPETGITSPIVRTGGPMTLEQRTMFQMNPEQFGGVKLSNGTIVMPSAATLQNPVGHPTIATPKVPLQPPPAKDEDNKSGEITVDEQGNRWQNGHIIATKEQWEKNNPTGGSIQDAFGQSPQLKKLLQEQEANRRYR